MLNSDSCIVCGNFISDPICIKCYAKQIDILLNEMGLHYIAKEIILNKIKHQFSARTLNERECTLCRMENVAICNSCFYTLLTEMLRELNFSENFIRSFRYSDNSRVRDVEIEFG